MEQVDAVHTPGMISKQIKWIVPDSIGTTYATHLLVQQQGSEFRLFFFEAELPLITGTQEEQMQAYQDLPEVNARCVAKVVMTADNIGLATNNMIESLNRFNTLVLAAQEKAQENARQPEHAEQPATS